MKSDAWNESISTIVYMRLIKTTSQQEINGIYEYFVLCNGSISEILSYWNNHLAEFWKRTLKY
jgi:hypothetical protein